MHSKSKQLFVLCLFALGACAADAPTNSDSEPTGEDSSSAKQPTKHADAGKGSATPDAAVKDAAVKDAGTKPAVVDAGPPIAHDAGAPLDVPDAGHVTGAADAGGGNSASGSGETGRMVGMTAAHNAVRAMVKTTPMLADMVWDPEVAAFAQQWTDTLANSKSTCDQPMHRSGPDLRAKKYGENLAVFGAMGRPANTPPKQAVDGWAAEVACWTYGTISGPQFMGTEKCDTSCYMNMSSDGCGHYTQVVWRTSTKLGCGVSTCTDSKGYQKDIWICNYSPAGNYEGQAPY